METPVDKSIGRVANDLRSAFGVFVTSELIGQVMAVERAVDNFLITVLLVLLINETRVYISPNAASRLLWRRTELFRDMIDLVYNTLMYIVVHFMVNSVVYATRAFDTPYASVGISLILFSVVHSMVSRARRFPADTFEHLADEQHKGVHECKLLALTLALQTHKTNIPWLPHFT